MIHEVEVSNLMFNKSSNDQIDFEKYDINIDLEEESSNEERTIIKYSLDLTSNPKNSVINISGNAILNGSSEEIEIFLKQENEKTPEVVSLIYQELFPLMYIISKNMNIPSPSHTLSQNNTAKIEELNKNFEKMKKNTVPQSNRIDNAKDSSNQPTNVIKNNEIKTSLEQDEQKDEKET